MLVLSLIVIMMMIYRFKKIFKINESSAQGEISFFFAFLSIDNYGKIYSHLSRDKIWLTTYKQENYPVVKRSKVFSCMAKQIDDQYVSLCFLEVVTWWQPSFNLRAKDLVSTALPNKRTAAK